MSSLEVYELTPVGKQLAHSIRNPNKPTWKVIHLLFKHHSLSKDQILQFVPDATPGTIAELRIKRVIMETTGSEVTA